MGAACHGGGAIVGIIQRSGINRSKRCPLRFQCIRQGLCRCRDNRTFPGGGEGTCN